MAKKRKKKAAAKKRGQRPDKRIAKRTESVSARPQTVATPGAAPLVNPAPTPGESAAESVQVRTAKKAAFLSAYETIGTISHAAQTAGIGRQTHYDWLQDPEYKKAFQASHAKAIDALEMEARRRAMRGTDEPIYYKGKIVGGVRKYSDTLLIFLLKAARPKKYRDNVKIEQSGGLKFDATLNMKSVTEIRQEILNHPALLDAHRAAALPKEPPAPEAPPVPQAESKPEPPAPDAQA
jgi:hypothetical protein